MPGDYLRKYVKPKKTVEQLLQDPSVFIHEMRIEPHTPLMRTNNFLQNTLSRLLAYSPTLRSMVKVKADNSGRLEMYEGMPGNEETRITWYGKVTDVANGETHDFEAADKTAGNISVPYTVPDGYRLYVKHAIISGTSPGEVKFQVVSAGAWTDVQSAFFDSYDESDVYWLVSTGFSQGTQVRIVVVNNGATGDFALALAGWLQKEVAD